MRCYNMEEKELQYWFYSLNYVGVKESEKLLENFGSVEEVYKLTEEEVEECEFLGEKGKTSILSSRSPLQIKKEYEYMQNQSIEFVCLESEEYPSRLRYINEPPKILFYKGRLPREEQKSVAVIGARNCSNYGKWVAGEIGKLLKGFEACLISGMARGIDGYGQQGILEVGGESYGVLGCGVDICYPRENKWLYDKLIKQGGVISEFKPGMPAKAINFPQRNRIISGLSDLIIVVEAKKRSGTSITVGYGLEQGKEIMAVPGRINDTLSEGCNQLIFQGAYPIVSLEDLRCNLEGFLGKNIKNNKKIENTLAREEKLVYDCLDFTPKNVAMVASELGEENIQKINDILFDLEIEERIEQITTGYYVRVK